MYTFVITLDDKVGELARITEAIAARNINITGFSGATSGDTGTILIRTNNDDETETALQDIRVGYFAYPVVEATLPHEPGSLAGAARRLADAGVNIEAAIVTGMSDSGVVVAFATSDPDKAKSILQ